jgi:replicative DNA helicase
MEQDRIPPQNVEAEMSVLGSMLMSSDAVCRCIELLNGESFYREAHRKTFSAMVELFEKDEAIDLITITEQLRRDGSLEAVGGASYLTGLVDGVPTSENVEYYAKIVKEKAVLRDMISVLSKVADECYGNPDDVGLFVDRVEQSIYNLSRDKPGQDFIRLKDIIHDSLETVEALCRKKQLVTGIPTGFDELNEITSGLQPSDLIIIAGRPSMGKSSLAVNLAQIAAVREKIPVAFFSLETSREQLVQRMLCSEARVSTYKLRTGFLSEAAFPRLTIAAGKLSEAPIFIDDTPAIPVLELRAKTRRLKARENVGLIIIDYLQLMQWSGRADNRQQEISEISRSLKSLARELRIPVVALSQLSRAVETRADHRPQLSDLRESGAIEQDADVVVLLLREEYYDPKKRPGEAEVIIAKQRNGPVGKVRLAFISEYTRFESISTRVESPA